MRQITAREKAFLSIGALVAVALFVWFILLPWLQSGDSVSSMEDMQAKLEAFEKLGAMGQPLIALEEEMKSQSGYEEISFRTGTANSVIISIINNFLSDAARQADIKNLENLDTKVETRRTQTETVSSEAVMNSVIDRLYLQQVVADLERIDTMEAEEVDRAAASSFDDDDAEDNEDNEENVDTGSDAPDENAGADENTEQIAEDDFDPDQIPPPILEELKKRGISVEELKKNPELRKKLKSEFDENVQRTRDDLPPAALEILKERGISVEQLMTDPDLQNELKKEIEARSGRSEGDNPSDDDENNQTEKPADSEASEDEPENESEESGDESPDAPEDVEQTETERPIFPLVPSDLPGEVRRSLGRAMEKRQGKSLLNNNIDDIINDAGFVDESDRSRIERRLKLYNNRVKDKKKEITGWFNKLGVLDAGKTSQKTGRFSVKMVFKSQIQQLVNLLYNLEDSARWLKVESVRISIADKKKTLLGVEINMTATALRDI